MWWKLWEWIWRILWPLWIQLVETAIGWQYHLYLNKIWLFPSDPKCLHWTALRKLGQWLGSPVDSIAQTLQFRLKSSEVYVGPSWLPFIVLCYCGERICQANARNPDALSMRLRRRDTSRPFATWQLWQLQKKVELWTFGQVRKSLDVGVLFFWISVAYFWVDTPAQPKRYSSERNFGWY